MSFEIVFRYKSFVAKQSSSLILALPVFSVNRQVQYQVLIIPHEQKLTHVYLQDLSLTRYLHDS